MSRWLQAARLVGPPLTKPTKPTEPADPGVLSVKSVLSTAAQADAEVPGSASPASDRARIPAANPDREGDAQTLLTYLHCNGPQSYGAAATTLGWGATRAWAAEARLRATGQVRHDAIGRAFPTGERGAP